MFIFIVYVVLGTIMLLNLLIAVRLTLQVLDELMLNIPHLHFRCWATRTTRYGKTDCYFSSWNAYVFNMAIVNLEISLRVIHLCRPRQRFQFSHP